MKKLTVILFCLLSFSIYNAWAEGSLNITETLDKALGGDLNAQKKISMMYFEGNGGKKNYKEAFRWAKKATEGGDAEAQFILGQLYIQGVGTKTNRQEGVVWLKKAADQDFVKAQYNLGGIYLAEKKYEDAIYWYEKAAEQGLPAAQSNLATIYVEQKNNYSEASKWLKKAADQEFPEASYSIGTMFKSGKGVEQNDEMAFKWYEKAAFQGLAKAQLQVGGAYLLGEGVKTSFYRGFVFLILAKKFAKEQDPAVIASADKLIKMILPKLSIAHQVELKEKADNLYDRIVKDPSYKMINSYKQEKLYEV